LTDPATADDATASARLAADKALPEDTVAAIKNIMQGFSITPVPPGVDSAQR
jgi:hypothetical protein